MPDEYISRAKALSAVQKQRGANRSPAQNAMLDRICCDIKNMPAADVAPVVYCKDCRYGKYAAWCEGYACCRTVGEYHRADFGCTAGELQTNGAAE